MIPSWKKSPRRVGAALVLALSACGPAADGGEGGASGAMTAGEGATAGMDDPASGAGGGDASPSCSPGDTPFVHNAIATNIQTSTVRAVGDLDGDGSSELILDRKAFFSTGGHNYEAGEIEIECGDAEACRVEAETVEPADLNGDGALDLVLKKSVYLNDGSGSFTWAGDLAVGGPTFDALIGDVDGDDIPDIIALAEDSSECNAERTRRENQQIGQACDPIPALRDGIQDVCPEGEECFQLPGSSDEGMCHPPRCGFGAVLHGAGDGTFNELSRFDIDYPWWKDNYGDRAVLADFDGDEIADVVYRVPFSQNDGSALLRRGIGDGTFGEAEMIEEQGPSIGFDTYAFDIDDDGDLDLMTQPYVLLNDGTGTFTEGEPLGGDIGPQNIPPADIDGDGRLEAVRAVFTSGSGDFAMRVVHPAGDDYEAIAEWCDPGVITDVDTADLDGDGRAEVIAAYVLKDFRIYQP